MAKGATASSVSCIISWPRTTLGKEISVYMPINRFMMQYLAWRVLDGLNRRIEISFLIVGHTKFAPDWCFGLLKQAYRRTKVGCLDDIVRLVESSAVVNNAQLVGREDGTVIVHQYNWAEFLPSTSNGKG